MHIKPDLIILGQVTVDDVVPATPAPWCRQIGGSSLYALAGARLWLDPGRIGLVARVGKDYPFDIDRLLRGVGINHIALTAFEQEHLVEWLIYEPDGSRRSLPRNRELLEMGAEGDGNSVLEAYRQKMLAIAPTANEIPASWLPAAAIHMCPQVGTRHAENLRYLQGKASWISVDPSPHYSRVMGAQQLAQFLHGATALLPSSNEVGALLKTSNAADVALQLHHAGFPEVAIKRGAEPVMLANDSSVLAIPTIATKAIDPTGAGDSFCGAYAACRLLGHAPAEAARRAAASAALVVGCCGMEAALRLIAPAA